MLKRKVENKMIKNKNANGYINEAKNLLEKAYDELKEDGEIKQAEKIWKEIIKLEKMQIL